MTASDSGVMRLTMHVLAYAPWDEPESGHSEVDATPDMTVSEVLEAGCGFGYAEFAPVSTTVTPDAPDLDGRLFGWHNLFGVNDEGRIVTNESGTEVAWGDFVRACQANLIEGDPHELVVRADSGAAGGSGGLLGLVELAQWLFDNREAVTFAFTLGGTAAGAELAIRRPLMKLPKAYRRRLANQWARNGITPNSLGRIIARRKVWDPDELGPYLGTTPKIACAVLGELGYAETARGLYERSTDPELRARRAAYRANAAYMAEAAESNTLDPSRYVDDDGEWE